eukprot:3868436-Prymnesium_polylepis.2
MLRVPGEAACLQLDDPHRPLGHRTCAGGDRPATHGGWGAHPQMRAVSREGGRIEPQREP